MVPRPPSLLARSLEPLVNSLWVLFVVWTVLVVGLWLGGDAAIASINHRDLRAAATLVAGASDALWLVLAAANVYLHLAERNGLTRARVIALTIGLTAASLAACSAWTGYPLGAVFYTVRLGMKLGPVPLGWPLLWLVVVVGGYELAAWAFPRASERLLSGITGGLAVITDLNLEPIATKFRLFWFWYVAGTHQPSPPLWRNTACWFVGVAFLAWLLRERRVGTPPPSNRRPAAIFLILNIVLILGHLRGALFR